MKENERPRQWALITSMLDEPEALKASVEGSARPDVRARPVPFSADDLLERPWWEPVLVRLADVVVAALMLVLSAPVIVLVALVIRLDSPGKAVFRQFRVGRDLAPFVFYKFRTMYEDARERFPELYEYRYTGEDMLAMRFKIENDPRLTRVGRRLRKTSLDELPNLLNVILGDMSLVGPRPEILEMVQYYEPWQRMKWHVKPGVTGLAQVQGRGYLTFQETVHWDVRWVFERSPSLYFRILLRTVRTVLHGMGAF